MPDEPEFTAFDSPDAFGPGELLACYARGVFPMAETRDDPRVFLIEPDRRGVIPLDGFRPGSRLARTVRQAPFDIRINTAFAEVLDACAAPGPGREDTWINPVIAGLYRQLHDLGFAHSVECWAEDRLVGGLYGVSLGGAFFGESMFSRRRDASKVALTHLVARLNRGGWRLLDAQFHTDHLGRFGAVEVSRSHYLDRLALALTLKPDMEAFTAPMRGEQALGYALQPITQAS